MADPLIKVIPTPYQDVKALLRSNALRSVEEPIAAEVGFPGLYEDGPSIVMSSYTQGTMSVSGMTAAEIEAYLAAHRASLIRFGVSLLRDPELTKDDEEYPEGEDQDSHGSSQVRGLSNGFGITNAIYHNFLANRASADFRAFLKNRRMPHAAKFAREVRRIFDAGRADGA